MSNKILIVDDASDDLELVKAMLSSNGFAVMTANHGREGLEKARTHQPNLIISDVLMPEMDGFALFKELRKDTRTSKIPIMILTVRGRMRDTFEAFGVESFMPKPFSADNLFSLINKYVTPAQAAASTAAPAEAKPKEAASAPAPAAAFAKPAAQAPEKPAAATAKSKALIFGSDDAVLANMVQLLEKEKCHAVVTQDETQLPVQVDSMEPELILLQVNNQTATPIDRIVWMLNSLIKKKIKLANSEVAASRKGNIVLFKVEEEMSGLDSMGASIADLENILDRCTDEGCKKYIGSFSPVLFISKIKEFIA